MGDAAGYVTKCSGEGIYFAAKSGRMAAEAIVEGSAKGAPAPQQTSPPLSRKGFHSASKHLTRASSPPARDLPHASACSMPDCCVHAGTRMVGEKNLRTYLDKFDRKYWATYKVLDILQKVSRASSICDRGCACRLFPKSVWSLRSVGRPCISQVFYRSNPAREAFVEMCESDYVQKMTFDSYLYKTVVPGNPLDDVRLLVQTVGSLLRGNALRQGAKSVSFGSRAPAEEGAVA